MKKVLFIGPYYLHPVVDRDSVYNVLPDLFKAVYEAGAMPVFVTGANNSKLLDELRVVAAPCEVELVESPHPNGFSRLRFILAARRLALRGDVAAIVNVCGAISYGFDALVAARLGRVRAVVRVSGNETLTRKYCGRYKGMLGKLVELVDKIRERLVFVFADRVVVMSRMECARIVSSRGSERGVVIAPRGVDLERFSSTSQRGNDRLRVLFVGRQSKEKGFDIFLEVARRLRHEPGIAFTMVGDFAALQQDNLEIISYVDPLKMPAVYQQHDVLLVTSRTEGFPQVVAEAMASGLLPIVPRHLFEGNFEEGVVMTSLDVEEITLTLEEYIRDRVKLNAGCEKARVVAEMLLDKRLCAGKFAAALIG